MAQLAEQLICNQQVIGSSPIIGFHNRIYCVFEMGRFPSGQRGQTVNLLQIASVVRIHLCPFFQHLLEVKLNSAGWSSLEARRAHNPKVIGSNPIPATQYKVLYAQLAQLVEQRTENPRVSGSIPELGIILFKKEYGVLAQSVEHLTFNQVVRGSNPRCLIAESLYLQGFERMKALRQGVLFSCLTNI